MTENGESSESLTITEIIQEIIEDMKVKIDVTTPGQEFRLMLEEDSSSECSSSSTIISSTENEDGGDRLITKIKKKMKKIHKKPLKEPDSEDELDESDIDESGKGKRTTGGQKYLKTKGELTIDDLEPVARLNIQLDETVKLIKMGQVISIVDQKLVIIQSILMNNEKAKPLDEDTILFDSNRKELGKIFEVFGPVQSPFYSIRFNNSNEIKQNNLNVDKDAFIYYAPDSTEYTKFIFNLDELRRLKGSDASWNNDNEPPVECLDYSDDEKEQRAKRELKQKRSGLRNQNSDHSDAESDIITIPNGSQGANVRNNKRGNDNTFKKSTSSSGGFNNNNFKNNYNNNNNNNRFNQDFNRPQMPQSSSVQNFSNNYQQFQQPPPQFSCGIMPPQQQQFPNYNFNNNWTPNNQPAYYNNFPPNQMNPFYPQHYQQFSSNFMPNPGAQGGGMPNNMNGNQFNPPFNDSYGRFGPNQHQQQQRSSFQPPIVDKRFMPEPNFIKKSF